MEFLEAIAAVNVSLNAGDLTIDAEFDQLEMITVDGFTRLVESTLAVDGSIADLTNVTASGVKALGTMIARIDTLTLPKINNELFSFHKNSLTFFKASTDSYANTALRLANLEKLVISILGNVTASHVSQDKFGEVIEKIDATVSSISGILELIQTITEAVQAFISSAQTASLAAILAAIEETNVLLAAFKAELPAKVLATIAATPFNMEAPGLVTAAFEGDLCEYDPFGIGPVVCEGAEAEGLSIPTLSLIPI